MTRFILGKISWGLLGLLLVIAISLASFGIKKSSQAKPTLAQTTATVLTTPRTIATFTLIDNKGKPFTNANLQGHWNLIFFGFTRCGMICPTTLAEITKVYQDLTKQNALKPEFWMVSIDPKRDDVARMNAYVTSFNPQFHGATGRESEVAKLAKSMSVVYMQVPSDKKHPTKDYQVDHSGAIMLVNPKGELVAFFTMPHNAATITADLINIEKYYS